ncbi:MAG: D-glycero-beta-D-manno-heptose-7-phosphate kinase [Proteobacteria bacterium]|nr:D-glycero-beta-D-manno-heptose-7-phosphate kinase [Pseudomonadota bacterium]MBU1710398.1 D-glycero-beta-D-manno-heptose-7-phosphate kinase [Pseudomonadota bacterium]
MSLTSKTRTKLLEGISSFKNQRILVIGDIIIDHFIWGSVSRISPEAPVPVVNVTRENLLLGGSANVLNNLYALGGRGSLCGIIGTDIMGDNLLGLLDDLSSPINGIIRTDDRPTTKKTRIIAQSQQVVRFDREKTGKPNAADTQKLCAFIEDHLEEFDAVIISDYNKGMINDEIMTQLQARLKKCRKPIPLIVDPKPGRPELFKDVTIITPNNHEAELMSGVAIEDNESLMRAADNLLNTFNCQAVLITRGEAGMALMEKGKELFSIPTVAKEVYDVTGAGDTVIATLALGLASGMTCADAATLANYAAGIVVGKVGTATASTDELLETIK